MQALRDVRLEAVPLIQRSLGRTDATPPITAKACCVLHRATGELLFAKNALVPMAPASLVKLATALLFARATGDRWDEEVRVEAADLMPGSTMGLREGEVVTRHDVLLGMLLPSGNDAALLAARLTGPDWHAQMERLCGDLGMQRTRFLNPHGSDRAGQTSCARDLALLARAAFSNPVIAQAAGTAEHRVNGRALVSTVRNLAAPGVTAGKTGSTIAAGACLALAYGEAIICLLRSKVAFRHGFVIDSTDRRYEDAERIMRAVGQRLAIGHQHPT